MSKYQPYPAYKDSGIEWLGGVPEHWLKSAIKFTAIGKDTLFIDGDWIESKDISDSGIKYITTGNVGVGIYKEQGSGFISDETFKKLNCTELFAGDLLVSRLNAPIGRACIVPELNNRVVTSVDNVVIRPNIDFSKQFLKYLFTSSEYFQHTSNLARGSTMQRISRGLLGNVRFSYPSLDEQKSIASFLDQETGKMDLLIEKQQTMIALLKEKRQAVISHAVTKGIPNQNRPNTKMKDSGIKWLGQIPEHWVVSKFGYLSLVVRGGSPRPAGDPKLFNGSYSPWVTVAEITKDTNMYLNQTESFLTELGSGQCRVFKKGTLILSNSGATLGVPKILNIDANANDGVVGFEGLSAIININFAYFYLFSLTTNLREMIKQGSGQPNLNTEIVKEIAIPILSLDEQLKVVDYIEAQTQIFDTLIEKSQQAIALLKERKTALISAAVTGKIDVRGVDHD